MLKIRYLCLAGILFFTVFIATQAAADSSEKKSPDGIPLSLSDIQKMAKQYKIEVKDWRFIKKEVSVRTQVASLTDQASWVSFLKNEFQGSWAIALNGEGIVFFLLPKGLDHDEIVQLKEWDQHINIDSFFQDFEKARPIKGTDLKQLPELISLQTASEIEKSQVLNYKRIVNPEQMNGGYSFRVRHDSRLDMMVPFEKNGQVVKGQMEGFTCFSSVYHFIDEHEKQLQGFRYGPKVYLSLKGDKSSRIMVLADGNEIQVASQSRTPGNPPLSFFLSGDHAGFQSLAKVHTDKGTITFADIVKMSNE